MNKSEERNESSTTFGEKKPSLFERLLTKKALPSLHKIFEHKSRPFNYNTFDYRRCSMRQKVPNPAVFSVDLHMLRTRIYQHNSFR